MIRRPPRSTQSRSSAASDVYKRQSEVRARRPLTPRPTAAAIPVAAPLAAVPLASTVVAVAVVAVAAVATGPPVAAGPGCCGGPCLLERLALSHLPLEPRHRGQRDLPRPVDV